MQQKLKALGVLDWIFAEVIIRPGQQVFQSMGQQEQPSTSAEQRDDALGSIAAVHSAAGWSNVDSRAPENPTASMAAMAQLAGERAGSLYSPPGPTSSSAAQHSSRLRPTSSRAAGQSHMLAEQSRNISPTKRPLVPLLMERVKSKSPPIDKKQAAAKASDENSLEDAYRDENRPPTVTRNSPSPVSNEAGGRIPPGFVSSGDMMEDLERLESSDSEDDEYMSPHASLVIILCLAVCLHYLQKL